MSRLGRRALQIWASPPASEDAEHAMLFYVLVGVLCALMAALVACFCWTCKHLRTRRSTDGDDGKDRERHVHRLAEAWPLAQLMSATDNFSERRLLDRGRGRHADVFKAILPGGRVLAVSRLTRPPVTATASFAAEIRALSRAHHPNVDDIVAYTEAQADNVWAYAVAVPLGPWVTLQQAMDDRGAAPDWARRVRVAAEVARGMVYLHDGVMPGIVHGALGLRTVLVDATWSARVAAYGEAAFVGEERRGSRADDVYAVGELVLRVMSGRSAPAEQEVVEWALALARNGSDAGHVKILDRRLLVPWNAQPLFLALRVACACVHVDAARRPSMRAVYSVLSDVDRDFNG